MQEPQEPQGPDEIVAVLTARLDGYDRRLGALETWAQHLYRHQRDVGYYLTPAPPLPGGALPAFPAPPAPAVALPHCTPAASHSAVPIAASSPLFGPSGSASPVATPMPVGAPVVHAAPLRSSSPQRGIAWRDVERFLTERGLAWAGGLALLLGAVFFLGLAIARGWLGPAARVGIGLGAGGALFVVGTRCFARRERPFGHVLVAVGTGVTATALFAGTRLYHLWPLPMGLLGAFAVAAATAVVAVRANAQIVAAYGLAGALLAPPLLGADVTAPTVAFLAITLIGTTGVALSRTWRWLPLVAFLLAAPQIAAWLLSDAPLVPGMLTLAGFGALIVAAAGGEDFRTRRDTLHPQSAVLVLAHAAFHVSVGLAFLTHVHAAGARGAFLAVTALAYGALGAYFLRTRGAGHGFGTLMAGTGIAALTLAVPVQYGGPIVPVAWAAEGAALAWLYGRGGRRFAGIGALVLGALAVLHLVLVEYPLGRLVAGTVRPSGVPFGNGNGMTLAFLLGALTVAGCVLPRRAVRAALTAIGFALVAYALPFETRGLALLGGWAALVPLALAWDRLAALAAFVYPRLKGRGSRAWDARLLLARVGGLAFLVVTDALGTALSPLRLGSLPVIPFTDPATVAAAIIIAAVILAALLAGEALARRVALLVGVATIAYLLPFEVVAAVQVAGWCALAVALALIERWDAAGMLAYRVGAGALGFAAVVNAFTVAPIERLAVHAGRIIDHPPFVSGATLALGALVVAFIVAARAYRGARGASWFAVGAALALVYLLSVGTVDCFAVGAGGDAASAAKAAQLALSVLWATIGGAAFALGLFRRDLLTRGCGLALLAVVTAKVFLYDLAALDTAYRVGSLVALGVLLLASAYLSQRQTRRADTNGGSQPRHG